MQQTLIGYICSGDDILDLLSQEEFKLYLSTLHKIGVKRSVSTDYAAHCVLVNTEFTEENLTACLQCVDNQIYDLVNPTSEQDQNTSAHNQLIRHVKSMWLPSSIKTRLISGLSARRTFGLQKYGTYLGKDQLRDSNTDFEQEMFDGLVYGLVSIRYAEYTSSIISVLLLSITLLWVLTSLVIAKAFGNNH